MTAYYEKLKDPKWQKKRLEILERDGWTCKICGDKESSLHVHHRRYFKNCNPWDYPNNLLSTLCEKCHENERKQRFEVEKELLNVLREKFWADDLCNLIDGFSCLELQDKSDISSWAVRVMLDDEKLQKKLIELSKEHDN